MACAESYIGLREALVAVLPGGGGVKELALRAARAGGEFDTALDRAFDTLSQGRMSNGAAEAFDLGFLRAGEAVTAAGDELLVAAKREALALAAGYRPPPANPRIRVAGRAAFDRMRTSLERRQAEGRASAHDVEIGCRIAIVLCGGEDDRREVEESQLLHLEREHFLALAQSEKTQARLEHLRATGKVLAN